MLTENTHPKSRLLFQWCCFTVSTKTWNWEGLLSLEDDSINHRLVVFKAGCFTFYSTCFPSRILDSERRGSSGNSRFDWKWFRLEFITIQNQKFELEGSHLQERYYFWFKIQNFVFKSCPVRICNGRFKLKMCSQAATLCFVLESHHRHSRDKEAAMEKDPSNEAAGARQA